MVATSTTRRPTLDVIRIASPCPAKWEEMPGDDRQRHCSQCKLNVYNLSELSREDAEAFLAEREGRVCVRLYRRHDGTVITRDCPVGLAAVRAQVVRLALATAGLFLACAATALAALDRIPGVSHYMLPYLSVGKIGHLRMQHAPPTFFAVGAICLPPIQMPTSASVETETERGAASAPLAPEE